MDARHRVEERLAAALLESQPAAAASVVEALEAGTAAALLAASGAAEAAAVLERMLPAEAGAALERMPEEAARERLAGLSPAAAAAVLRRLDPGARERLLATLDPGDRATLEPVLAAPEGTAAALMDPRVLALPTDLDVRAARARLMERPGEAHYNVYVVERDGTLVGVLNLRELLASPERETLRAVMREATFRVPAGLSRLEVIAHPGWRHVHSLPVVDDAGRFLGAIRFRTLRELEDAAFRRREGGGPSTGGALGELYWAGVSGMLSALVSALAPETPAGAREDGDAAAR